MQQPGQGSTATVIGNLIQSAGQPDSRPFRERARMVGAVYTISYTDAIVAVYDYDREQAGGLPKSTFLMAAKPEEDETFILLRIQKEARLPSAAANDQTRQERGSRSSCTRGRSGTLRTGAAPSWGTGV